MSSGLYGRPVVLDPMGDDPQPPRSRGGARLLLVPLLAGALVALTIGVYGNVHQAPGVGINLAGFSNPGAAKTWVTSGAFLFALVQVVSALVMYEKVPGVTAPWWIDGAHRWSGRIAFLLAVPVAIHCLYWAGFQTFDARVLAHSLLGCAFFGAFTVKMLGLRKDGLPGWALPLLGGLVFAGLVGLWWTSARWYFQTAGVHF